MSERIAFPERPSLTAGPIEPAELLAGLRGLRDEVRAEAAATLARWEPLLQRPSYAESARNLASYLALRRTDLRAIQTTLMPLGLSSLGRCEARVMPNLDAVITALAALLGEPAREPLGTEAFFRGEQLLRAETEAVFGPQPRDRDVRIMVTLGDEAATDSTLVHDLVLRGMDCARINCGHDDATVWEPIIANVRSASVTAKRPCRIAADLSGPRLRVAAVADRSGDDVVRVHTGDRLALVADATHVGRGDALAVLSCSHPAVLARLRVGDPVWIDAGRIGAIVEKVSSDRTVMTVTSAREKGVKLRTGKGMNVPRTVLGLPPLTDKDRSDLAFLARRADIISYSFVRDVAGVDALLAELDALRLAPAVAVILKIETADAVENLPELIVHAAGRRPCAVMIARGDLAVEIGYRRLAEMQEEMLWLCEAAHVPVIWATDVLDSLVKDGTSTRAEFTDAAMAERADCVMLNKGTYVVEGVTTLVDVLSRMQGHQRKKTSRLRALHAW
ncbi:MAG TPA: pyruvate kinase [Candidatus Limnocylindria bacterium]|nr:pyruvate kinase [Candidatus Limnocylindria bacterium]